MQFSGHFHPVLVHLPIGILLLAFGLECLSRWGRRQDLRPAITLALAAGAMTAVLTAGTGWLLAQQGGYDAVLLQRHQVLGFSAAALAVFVWGFQKQPWYFPAFALAVAVLVGAGHFGGSLTHGANYLWETTTENKSDTAVVFVAAPDPESPVFTAFIQPVLEKKCLSCHNASKHKGDLRLDAPEFIRRGGKDGMVLDTNRLDTSPLLKRLLLPLHDDDHMPPAGKPQLSNLEIQLLDWWVRQGASFEAKIKEHPLPGALQKAIQTANAGNRQNPVFALPVQAAAAADLQKLSELMINARPLSAGSPWLTVSFAGVPRPTASHWDALQKIKNQTVDLDLAYVNAGTAPLNEFGRLVRLNLAHAGLPGELPAALSRMPYLESLNLTGTPADDAVLATITKLPRLQHLYLWETAVSAAGVERLRQQCPRLYIETGNTDTDTTRLVLPAPKLQYSRSFFDDTLQVAVDFPAFKGISLYYTIDEAASPTTQSPQYETPVVLDHSAHIRVFAGKEGWLPSAVVDALFIKKQVTPIKATLEKPPSPQYPAKGAVSLIDGAISSEQGADTWLGYQGEHLNATLELAKPTTLSRVFVHCLENNSPWIFKPVEIRVETSLDGKLYRLQGSSRFPANTKMGELKTHLLACGLSKPTEARFVKVTVKSPLKNPPWHPAKGDKCWIFVDELVLE